MAESVTVQSDPPSGPIMDDLPSGVISGVRRSGANARIRQATSGTPQSSQQLLKDAVRDLQMSSDDSEKDEEMGGATSSSSSSSVDRMEDEEDHDDADDDDDVDDIFGEDLGSADPDYDDLTVWDWDSDDTLPPPPPPFDVGVPEEIRPVLEEAQANIRALQAEAQARWEEFQIQEEDRDTEMSLEDGVMETVDDVAPSSSPPRERRRSSGQKDPPRRPLDPEVYRAGKRVLRQISAVLFVHRFEVETLFRFFDVRGNGLISKRELRDGIKSLMNQKNLPRHITESDIRSAFAVLLDQPTENSDGDSSAAPASQDEDRRTITYEQFFRVFSKTDPWFGFAPSSSGAGGQTRNGMLQGQSSPGNGASPVLPFRRVKPNPPSAAATALTASAAAAAAAHGSAAGSHPSLSGGLSPPPRSHKTQSSATMSSANPPPRLIRGSIHGGPRLSSAAERAYRNHAGDRPLRRRSSVPSNLSLGLSASPGPQQQQQQEEDEEEGEEEEEEEQTSSGSHHSPDSSDQERTPGSLSSSSSSSSLSGRRRRRPATGFDDSSPAGMETDADADGSEAGGGSPEEDTSWNWLPRHLAWQKAALEADSRPRKSKRRKQSGEAAGPSSSASDHEIDYHQPTAPHQNE